MTSEYARPPAPPFPLSVRHRTVVSPPTKQDISSYFFLSFFLHLELLHFAGLPLDVLADLSEDLLEVLVHLQQASDLVGVRTAASRYSEDAALALGQVHLPQRQIQR